MFHVSQIDGGARETESHINCGGPNQTNTGLIPLRSDLLVH
jgi:hypothetical protein